MLLPVAAAPGPRHVPVLGRLLDFLGNEPYDLIYRYTRDHGDFLSFKVLTQRLVVVNTPALIRPVVEDVETFEKGVPNPAVGPIVGESIFAGNRPTWTVGREHHPYARDYAAKAFAGMVPAMVRVCRAHLAAAAAATGPEDLYPRLIRMLYDVFCTNVIGQTTDEPMYKDYLRVIREVTFRVTTQGITIDPFFWRVLARWNRQIAAFIDARRQAAPAEGPPVDALAFVMRHGTALSPTALRDEVSTMLLGGIHPVGTALSAALHNLSRFPAAARPVVDEARAFAAGLRGRDATADEYLALPHLDRFIDESMRLAPPVHIISRRVKDGRVAVVNGHQLEAGTEVIYAPFAVHRNPTLWPDPLEFRPDRFLSEPEPFTYLPFGLGERTCMGRPYARLCLRVVIATLLSAYDLAVDASKPLATASGPLILVPKHPLVGRITRV
jgi:cytochrome P450